MMKEHRVRVRDFGSIPKEDPRLVEVASTRTQQRLHWFAAAKFAEMRAAAQAAGHDLRIVSGWRGKKAESRHVWDRRMIARYGSIAEARKWRAYSSPHETGLAFDLGSAGLAPVSATARTQRETPAYQWLVKNAHKYGVTPYLAEPWHWEVNTDRGTWERTRAPMPATLAILAGLATVAIAVRVMM